MAIGSELEMELKWNWIGNWIVNSLIDGRISFFNSIAFRDIVSQYEGQWGGVGILFHI